MRGAGRQSDASIYRGAGTLVDQGIVPKYFHRFDRAGEAGGDRSGNLYGRRDGGVIVGASDNNAARSGEGGGQIIGSGMPMLQEGDGAGSEDQENAEDNILDKAALGAENSGRAHRRIRTNTPLTSPRKKAGFYLDVCKGKGVIK